MNPLTLLWDSLEKACEFVLLTQIPTSFVKIFEYLSDLESWAHTHISWLFIGCHEFATQKVSFTSVQLNCNTSDR